MTTNLWDWYAAIGYDALNVLLPYEALQRAVLTTADLCGDEHLLVAGCGTGNFERLAASLVPDLTVDAVDFSATMLARARNKCLTWENIHHQQADLCAQLPFPEAHVDVAVMCNVLYALPDGERALRELHRVIRPGGRLILCDRHPWSGVQPVMKEHMASLSRLPWQARVSRGLSTLIALPTLIGVGVVNNSIQQRYHEGQYRFYAEDEISALLNDIGFAVQSLDTVYASQCWLAKAIRQPSQGVSEGLP